ncbi:hypothetical protein DL96DRAFT_1558333 [Flagelloscypha sp. PMI_526]|nr:hypothetical protein DL96DRAFT_1558333 [Flagelloscypha sp. PMI_526]
MRFFATLSCIFPVFLSVASAVSIHIRDAQTKAQPNMMVSVTARQNAMVTFEDGGFEADPSVSPWGYDNQCSTRSDAHPHSVEGSRDVCILPHPVKLTRGTEYELTFYEEPRSHSISDRCSTVVELGGRFILIIEEFNRPLRYKKRTTRFVWNQEEENAELQFKLGCLLGTKGIWRVDDVSLTEVSGPGH